MLSLFVLSTAEEKVRTMIRVVWSVQLYTGKGGDQFVTKRTPISAPRGQSMTCKGWQQEAALRMLMNNLEVAEQPEDLIVYGGTGKAARNWECYDAIVKELRELGDDETLLIQSENLWQSFRPTACSGCCIKFHTGTKLGNLGLF